MMLTPNPKVWSSILCPINSNHQPCKPFCGIPWLACSRPMGHFSLILQQFSLERGLICQIASIASPYFGDSVQGTLCRTCSLTWKLCTGGRLAVLESHQNSGLSTQLIHKEHQAAVIRGPAPVDRVMCPGLEPPLISTCMLPQQCSIFLVLVDLFLDCLSLGLCSTAGMKETA